MKIIRARLKPMGGATEFISVKGRIKALILNNPGDTFDFVVDDNGVKSVKQFGTDNINPDLVGKEIPIIDDSTVAVFTKDGIVDAIDTVKEGALPQKHSVDQLKKIRTVAKGTDIGDRVNSIYNKNANIQYARNPIDTGIESYDDYQKKNKSFIPNWNLKHLVSPFRNDNKHGKNSL
jgi:hypothetical protein